MPKILGMSLALTMAFAAILTLVSTGSAAPFNGGTVVYGDDGQAIGQDPDLSIRSMLRRDQHVPDEGGE